ncbi:telomerase-binding protein EST1A-like protein [Leptotrombidium deliense]|uniref:Telomerase-binding protein EST1A-like protein n=1 Tax=Leptotrombidium deliense TaxID=299467 RepID=A0A443SFT8_9ACAR|nr:telomerase-binding protein EST1A-like protein [Leptotrombidium deliense]
MVYYRPGMMSRLNKKMHTFSDTRLVDSYTHGKHVVENRSNSMLENSTECKFSKLKQSKKPDKQVYVAKARNCEDKKADEKSKSRHRKEKFETIPNFVFENSKFNKNEDHRKRVENAQPVQTTKDDQKDIPHQNVESRISINVEKQKRDNERDEISVTEKNVFDKQVSEKSEISPNNESDLFVNTVEGLIASSSRQKLFKSNYPSIGKPPKKYSSRSDFKFEQNLPPRLQKKLQMEKYLQCEKTKYQIDVRKPHSMVEQSQQVEQSSVMVNRGGIIRLPPNTAAAITAISSPHSKSSVYQQTQEERGDAVDMMRSRQYGILTPRQLFNPYQANKPCVVIRPTYQTVISHANSRPDVQGSHVSSPPTADILTFNHLTYSYPYNRIPEHNLSVSSSRSNFLVDFPSSSSTCVSNVTGILPIPRTSIGAYDNSSLMRKKLKPVVEKNMKEVLGFEKELQLMLSRNQTLDERSLNQIRWKIQLRYEHIILTDLKFCAECNIEQMLWKCVFYQFIEMHRKELEENSREESKDSLNKLVEEASTFFENLLVNLQDKFEFNVDQYIEHEYDPEIAGYDIIKLAAISAQKIYLYLGDLARYKEQASGTSNFGRARSCYLKAQQLAPKNGRPYNQLALLAMYGRRKLDAVYYYMRSLAASNPFQSARENLLGIFDEVRKKYENAEKKRLEEKLSRLKLTNPIPVEDCGNSNVNEERLEIWIRPDGTSSKHTSLVQNFSAEEEFDMLTDVDLNKRFVLSFLHVHGKLFTKVGMENFIPAVKQMLLELRCLLKRRPSPISSQRLLQLIAISMFSVYHTSIKRKFYSLSLIAMLLMCITEVREFEARYPLQEQAIQVTLATVSLLVERANISLQEHLSSRHSQNSLVSDDVAELLPAIKVWTDWMSCQKQLWSPPPQCCDLGCKQDIWSLFADVLTTLANVNIRSVKLLPTKFDGCEPVILPEDTSLSGFIPLLGAPQCSSFVQPPYDKEKARTCLRISRIQFFGDYLCGIPEPYLEFDVEKKRFYSLVSTSNMEEVESNENCFETSDNETDDIPTDSSSLENINSLNEEKSKEDREIEELWSRQEELKRAQKREEKVRQHLNSHKS